MAAAAARTILFELKPQKSVVPKRQPVAPKRESVVPKLKSGDSLSLTDNTKIVLQPRLCTLRSYGSDQAGGLIRTRGDGSAGTGSGVGTGEVSTFFASLSEYLDNSRKSQDFEIISGRLAMVVFASTVTMEIVTGNTLFKKMDLQRIAEVGGVCLGAVVCAAAFAWFSSARTKVDRIFTVKCNSFIDSLIDNLIEGLFFDNELGDWSDDM